MSEVKLSQKWAVASFFSELPEGFEFGQKDTPLHATLAGVFAYPARGDEIANNVRHSVNGIHSFKVRGDVEERWGEGLVVCKLAHSEIFTNLLLIIQNALTEQGAVFNEPQYLGAGFTPHATVQQAEKLMPGSTALINSVSLVDMFPDGDGYRRRIHKVIKLGSTNAS